MSSAQSTVRNSTRLLARTGKATAGPLSQGFPVYPTSPLSPLRAAHGKPEALFQKR